jgi:hypothetical protein
MPEPTPCPDCGAVPVVIPCTIARRGGGRAVINFVEVEHENTCPRLRGLT